MRIGAILLILAFFSSDLFALDTFLSAGYGRGGSNLSDLTGGQNYNTQAGSGLFLTGGALLPISATIPHRFEVQLGAGFLFQDDARDESRAVSWQRWPVEAINYYRNTQELFRLGWGLIYQFNNKISAKGSNSTAAANVGNALGWTVAFEKLFPTGGEDSLWGIGLKYNFIKYHSASFSRDADGNCLFVTLSGLWL